MIRQLVGDLLCRVPEQDLLAHLKRITAYDRYQASDGIAEAASYFADTARAVGLDQVSVDVFPADGMTRWWSYRAPLSWTPTQARLRVFHGDRCILDIDHAAQPFSLATYSAPTPRGGVTAPLVSYSDECPVSNLAGAIAVVSSSANRTGDWFRTLAERGAIGFVTGAPRLASQPHIECVSRVELDPHTALFGFSLTSSQAEYVESWAGRGAFAHAVVDVDRRASMPVVTALLPGEIRGEIWLTAHLCHPRPGANDNASGVAALLGVAAALLASRRAEKSWRSGRSIRFVCGPEFVGLAAFLHRRNRVLDQTALPSAVINLDMVGENQSVCGGPFVVERGPDHVPSLINPLAERVVDEVFACTAADPGIWRPAPFMGFSDHALFADPLIGSPAVQLCHGFDRFNHSSEDSLDKVSSIEMVRATTAAAALARILANQDALPPVLLERLVLDWCAAEASAARRIARQHASIDGGRWAAGLLRHVDQRNASLLSLVSPESAPPSPERQRCGRESRVPGAALGRWPGPFNTRAMIEDMPLDHRAAILELVRADKSILALLLNFAIRADGCRSQSQIVAETSFALGQPVEDTLAARLFEAMIASGWVTGAWRD